MSITYNGTDLTTGNYRVNKINHESSAENIIDSMKAIRNDGVIVVGDTLNSKVVEINGIITADSTENLETYIDNLKALVSVKDGNLDIEYAGGTRRYVCRLQKINIDRNFFHRNFAPFTVIFLVPSGLATDIEETEAFYEEGITTTEKTFQINYGGSYSPKPKYKIYFEARGDADIVRLENVDTGEYIEVDLLSESSSQRLLAGYGVGTFDTLVLDEESKTVSSLYSGNNLSYRGRFPEAKVGINNFKLTFLGFNHRLGTSDDRYFSIGETFSGIKQIQANFARGGDFPNSRVRAAQSFIAPYSGRLYGLRPTVHKYTSGSLSGGMNFNICKNVEGQDKPDTSDYISADYSIAHDDIPTGAIAEEVLTTFSDTDDERPFLIKGQKYWIYLYDSNMSAGDGINYYVWRGVEYDSGSFAIDDFKSKYFKDGVWKDGYANFLSPNAGEDCAANMEVNVYFNRHSGGSASHNVILEVTYTKKYL